MKYIKQFGVILFFAFLGEVLNALIPLPIPASIYGLLLLFTALFTHIISLEAVYDAAKFLIEIMPLMFIPASVGLMTSWGILKGVWLPVVVITLLSTVVVMAVTGKCTDLFLKHGLGKSENEMGTGI